MKSITKIIMIGGLSLTLSSCATGDFSQINKKYEPIENYENVKVVMTNANHTNCEYQGKIIVDGNNDAITQTFSSSTNLSASKSEITKRLQKAGAKVGANLITNIQTIDKDVFGGSKKEAQAYHCSKNN